MQKITLKAARVNAGLNQKEACEILGISAPTLIKCEKGKKVPSIPLLDKMSKAYNVSSNLLKY